MKVGVVVRTGPRVEGQLPLPFAEIREAALRMEAVGVDSIWVYDHLLYRWPGRTTDGIWEAWTALTALATLTERVEVGTLVLCTPFRNPALLAKMASTLDEISGGRLILGLGGGWHQPEFDAFGVPFDHRLTRLEEALRIIKPLLREGRAAVQGRFYAAHNCENIPRGPRETGPPLLVAGSGPRMLELVARHADAWNTAWHASAEAARPRIETMRSACERVGRDPRSLEVTVAVPVVYPELGNAYREGGLSGSAARVAEALHGFADIGVNHAIVELAPFSLEAIERFGESVRQFRGNAQQRL